MILFITDKLNGVFTCSEIIEKKLRLRKKLIVK